MPDSWFKLITVNPRKWYNIHVIGKENRQNQKGRHMIIDRIMDRYDGDRYVAREFYYECMQYTPGGDDISRAMDYGEEKDVQDALCEYVRLNKYTPALCEYIRSVRWLEDDRRYYVNLCERNGNSISYVYDSKVNAEKKFDECCSKKSKYIIIQITAGSLYGEILKEKRFKRAG